VISCRRVEERQSQAGFDRVLTTVSSTARYGEPKLKSAYAILFVDALDKLVDVGQFLFSVSGFYSHVSPSQVIKESFYHSVRARPNLSWLRTDREAEWRVEKRPSGQITTSSI
jgi:hypothetical protein